MPKQNTDKQNLYKSTTDVSDAHKKHLKNLGARLDEIRKEKGVNVFDLCEKVKISRTTYYRIKNGLVYFNSEKFMKICDALEIQIEVSLSIKDVEK